MPTLHRFVVCYCSRCGPAGQTVSRATRDQHDLDDLDPSNAVSQPSPSLGFDSQPESRATAGDDRQEWDHSFEDTGIDLDWGNQEQLPAAAEDGRDEELRRIAAVDDTLVPTMVQLRSEWRTMNDSTQAPRPESLWLFELLLVWLNATFGLSEQICALLLTFVEAIVAQTTQRPDWIPTFHTRPNMSVRLRRVRQGLWQGSISVLYALCPDSSCWTPHLLDSNTPTECTRCQEKLLRGYDSSDDNDDVPLPPASSPTRTSTTKTSSRRPKLALHYEPISSWLLELARRENFFQLCDQWRTSSRQAEVYEDIYDGAAWKHDGPLQSTADRNLSLTLMIDSVQPFSRNGTAPYSCCVISLRIDNLPRQHRNSPDSTHVCCILPGPRKPKLEALQSVLQVVITELHRLGNEGLDVLDWEGTQHHLRARLRCLIADTEARTSVAGFPHHSSKDQFCPWCVADGNTWVQQHLDARPFAPRTVGDHRRDCLAALRDTLNPPSATDVLLLRRAAAAAPCALYKLDEWSSLTVRFPNYKRAFNSIDSVLDSQSRSTARCMETEGTCC